MTGRRGGGQDGRRKAALPAAGAAVEPSPPINSVPGPDEPGRPTSTTSKKRAAGSEARMQRAS